MRLLQTQDFNFDLPQSCIAQNPLVKRDNSKLLFYNAVDDAVSHLIFFDIFDLFKPGDVIVLNNSKVIKARLMFEFGGKQCEMFLLKKLSSIEYLVLLKPGKAFPLDLEFDVKGLSTVRVKKVFDDGSRLVQFVDVSSNFEELLEKYGETPLPPYIRNSSADDSQYQTVYAKDKGSVAAPTAGLHFTSDLINKLKDKGVVFVEVSLHVGRGTFMPVKTERIEDHVMHEEDYSVSEDAVNILNQARRLGHRIIAVGTTSVRVLESSFLDGAFVSGSSTTNIFIYPPNYVWKSVDGLITNFHLPKSTLLMLVASFLEYKGCNDGRKKLLDLYNLAINHDYRFYSFGDAMLLI